ncbi:Tyrosine-protein kinase ptk [invertebrate metagenome]|uniref:non-specific protein-tyrosine kinase n=1 Tax=invertebrate metagenome TaxID=1711999 RepID=A0A2H9TBF4_9ZZZZ
MQQSTDVSAQGTAASQDEDIIDLRSLFTTLFHYRWAILGFTLIVTLLTVLVVFSITPKYQATAVLLIEQEQAKVVSIEEVYGIDGGGDSYLNTQHEVLKSRALVEKVVKKLNLIDHPEFNHALREEPWYVSMMNWRQWLGLALPQDTVSGETILNRTIDAFAENVRIEPVRKTQVARIHVMSEDPQLAATAANAMGEAYIESWLEAKLSLTTNATRWMQDRLQDLSEKLKTAESQLHKFRVSEDLVDIEGVLTISTDELKALTESLVETRRKLTLSENIYRQIQDGKNLQADQYQSLPAVLAHPLVQQLKQREAELEQKVRELGRRYGPKHPKMIAANTELESISNNIRLQVQRIVLGVENEFEVARANEQSLVAAMTTAKQAVQTINSKQFRLKALEREVRTNKDLYDAFFKRIQETSATSDLQSANARVVDRAFTPEHPVKPKKKLIVGIAALLSLLIACGMAYLLEMLNNTIRTAKDVEDQLNLPVLGVLPEVDIKASSVPVSQLFINKDISKEQRAFVESVRTIRTGLNLSLMSVGQEAHKKIIAITSTMPGEGKSSVAANLSSALGQLGSVVLVDGDLRRPTVGKNFSIKGGSAGLANLLSGHAQMNECLHPRNSIMVMPAGMMPPDPTQLFAEEKFKNVLSQLSERFDTVIMDCPPMQGISDTLMISQLCDAVVYVVEAGRASKTAISHSTGRLLQNSVPLTGVVLNKVNTRRGHEDGYYGYYDYHGYSDGHQDNKKHPDAQGKRIKTAEIEPESVV